MVETDIITASLIGWAINTSDNVCQDTKNWGCYFHWKCHNAFDVTLTDNFQYQLVCRYRKYHSRQDQTENVKITDNDI